MQRNWAIVAIKTGDIIEVTDENNMPVIKPDGILHYRVERSYILTESEINSVDFQEKFKKLRNWEG